jgi:hypothetical protein
MLIHFLDVVFTVIVVAKRLLILSQNARKESPERIQVHGNECKQL